MAPSHELLYCYTAGRHQVAPSHELLYCCTAGRHQVAPSHELLLHIAVSWDGLLELFLTALTRTAHVANYLVATTDDQVGRVMYCRV